MQSIGDYLKKLLYQYDCVVVPTLGAFLTRAVSASFNEATGQFLPPRRRVAFNEALLLDDGVLINYVMLHEGITRNEALAVVHLFVTNLKQQARQMGSFSLEGLGLFSYNSENSLQFDPELRHNFLNSTYGMQPVMVAGKIVHLATPTATPMAMPTADVLLAVKPLPISQVRSLPAVVAEHTSALSFSHEQEGQVLSMPVRQKGMVWRWAAAALLVGSIGFVSYFSVINPGEPFQSSLNPASLFRFPEFLRREAVSDPSSIATRPAVLKATKSAVAKAEIVRSEPVRVSAPMGVIVPIKASVPSPRPTTSPVSVLRRSNVPKPLVVARSEARMNFTVIAGSFASSRNAVRFRKRLVEAGYADAFILQGRGLIKVAAIGTKSVEEAQAGVDSLRALTGITPWIMRK